jgi:hypothetical protein
VAQVIPVRLGAQADLDHNNQTHHHYKLIDVGTFGGPQNWVNGAFEGTAVVVSNAGTVVGGADTSNSDPNYPNVNPFLGSCFCSAMQTPSLIKLSKRLSTAHLRLPAVQALSGQPHFRQFFQPDATMAR